MKKAVIHEVKYFIACTPRTWCGIYVDDFDKITATGKVTCKNCLRTL